jgi:hypothetical protein
MERKTFLTILGLSLLALAIALLMPGRKPDPNPRLPWDIQVTEDGSSSVFGITFGKSVLSDAQKVFAEEGEVSLFLSGDDKSIEAYFKRIYLSGLRADFILTLDIDKATLEQIYQRGVRLSTLESGVKQVSLDAQDMDTVIQAVVTHITYLPAANLDEKLVQSRFGEPELRIDGEDGASHWLYPKRGLDIAVNPEGKEVFQYVAPSQFDRIRQPLEQAKAK